MECLLSGPQKAAERGSAFGLGLLNRGFGQSLRRSRRHHVVTRRSHRRTSSSPKVRQTGTKPYVVYDSEVVGLSIRVAPFGAKSWRVEYRVAPGGRGSGEARQAA